MCMLSYSSLKLHWHLIIHTLKQLKNQYTLHFKDHENYTSNPDSFEDASLIFHVQSNNNHMALIKYINTAKLILPYKEVGGSYSSKTQCHRRCPQKSVWNGGEGWEIADLRVAAAAESKFRGVQVKSATVAKNPEWWRKAPLTT